MSEGIDALLKERGGMYGEAVDNFTAIGRGWGAILNIEDIPPYQVALLMDFLKTIRCATNPTHSVLNTLPFAGVPRVIVNLSG